MSRAGGGSGMRWTAGNRVDLIENGEAFYRRVFAAIDGARRELQLETFILFEDEVGWALHARLLDAARRGVKVQELEDGYGWPGLWPDLLAPPVLISAAGKGNRFSARKPGRSAYGDITSRPSTRPRIARSAEACSSGSPW